MALGFYFAPAALTAEKYDECIKLLRKAGAGHPKGRTYHASFGPSDKLIVFDVFTSQAAFDQFGRTLAPILQQLGIDPGAPQVMPIHKIIVPPSAKAKPKRRSAAKPARRKAAKTRCPPFPGETALHGRPPFRRAQPTVWQ